MKEEQEHIPTSKVERATKFLKTGAKVGANYLKHYSKKMVNPDLSRDELDKQNAEDIFSAMTELKGSALKAAQMLSMDQNILPKQFMEKFATAQYNAPPLSFPLVVKTFKEQMGKSPSEVFDTFSREALHAASMGQVHQAELNGQKLAVKVQYPGVGDSIKSDLNMVRPLALTIMRMNAKEAEQYIDEVEARLMEEADYEHELNQAEEITNACAPLEFLAFPKYYRELSTKRILTMEWIDGVHLTEFLKTNPSQEVRNQIGQQLWDFYDFQIHNIQMVHADPHPGNFLVLPDHRLAILDFGCVKRLPMEFYNEFKLLLDPTLKDDDERIRSLMYRLTFLLPNDSEKDKEFFFTLFKKSLELFGRPVHSGRFDFSKPDFFMEIFEHSEGVAKMKMKLGSKLARGPKDGMYLARVYYGLFNLLHSMGATIDTKSKYV
ncbi:AarF/UbiB family protein [soil metagenome]